MAHKTRECGQPMRHERRKTAAFITAIAGSVNTRIYSLVEALAGQSLADATSEYGSSTRRRGKTTILSVR